MKSSNSKSVWLGLAVALAAGALNGCSGSSSPESMGGSTGGGNQVPVVTGTGGAATGGATTPIIKGTGGAGTGGAASGGAAPVSAGTGGAGTGGVGPAPRRDAGVGSDGAMGGGPARDAGASGDAGPFPVSAGKPTVYLAGDSTVSTYSPAQLPQQGWGQRLQEFFTSDVVVVNRAIGGESSKSFADKGHLAEILAVIKPGDYLFAQWGINDRSVAGPDRATDPATTFRTYLRQYIDGARAKNAIPVLITPTPRHQFANGVFQNGFPTYCAAIIAVGAETNTPVIDLQSKGLAYYTSIGDVAVTANISLDALHFKVEGALQMARLVAQGVSEINVPISPFVVQSKL